MTLNGHLAFQELRLGAAQEAAFKVSGWGCFRVNSGLGYVLGTGRAQALSPGDLVVCAGSPVTLRASQIDDLQLQYFGVTPELLPGLLTLPETEFLRASVKAPGSVAQWLPASHAVAEQFRALSEQVREKQPGLGARCLMLQIMAATAGRELEQHRSAGAECEDAASRFQALLAARSEGELLATSPSDLARQCGCSERHFNRLFRKHFGCSIRHRQIEVRLQRARQLLRQSNFKIIDVALESGFRHLGLFNSMFKRRFGITPSQWRAQARKKTDHRRSFAAAAMIFLLATLGWFPALRAETNAPAQLAKNSAASVAPTNAVPTFEVRGYEINGNTVLTPDIIVKIVKDYLGPAVTFETIRSALAELQLAYRGRGYVTVKVSLPQQKLTNGIVQVQVTEGKLSEIQVVGNNWFSTETVLRALPYLQTNVVLNSLVFQQELDRANQNRDRQIYPVINPGPEPGTTALTLKVKDQFPMHGKFEVNNLATPNTPNLRMNTALQYNNCWDLEHQFGLQYGFTPEEMKPADKMPRFFDQPLIANYSAFYRMPINVHGAAGHRREVTVEDFGYDEVTRRFRPPPITGGTEAIFYASRSDSDTGIKLGPRTLVAQTPLVTIESQAAGQDVTINQNVGGRLIMPVLNEPGIQATFSAGLDFKSYDLSSFNTNVFYSRTIITNSSGDVLIKESTVPFAQAPVHHVVDYLPLAASLDLAVPDKWGSSAFNIGFSANLPIFSHDEDFAAAAYTTNARASYRVLNLGFTREQKIYGEWALLLRANGQWTDQPLISNEQFGIGGTGGVRGYIEGEEYGDTGFRLLTDLRTPLIDIGMVDGTFPMRVRGTIFTDVGRRYLIEGGPGREQNVSMWGAGFGFAATIGQTIDMKLTVAWPLLGTRQTDVGQGRVYFSAGAQF